MQKGKLAQETKHSPRSPRALSFLALLPPASSLRALPLVALAVFTLGAGIIGGAALAAPAAKGWHGEEMPAGLVRGEREGEYRWKKDGSIMVYVPPGAFTMGIDDGDAGERPVHEVELDGFYIDKYELSWGQWKKSGLPYSESPSSRLRQPRAPDWGIHDDQPVVNVTWEDAQAYVRWAGKRLPTEAEWEKAARGTDGRTFPWGNEPPTVERAVWVDNPIAEASTAPVDCCAAGVSPYGVYNLAGNVYEWCEDVYDGSFYTRSPKRNPVNRDEGRYRALRGGALVMASEHMRSGVRYRLLPIDRTPYIGFRAALSAPPSTPAAGSGDQEETP